VDTQGDAFFTVLFSPGECVAAQGRTLSVDAALKCAAAAFDGAPVT
jgi:hypothetical protein